MLSNFAIVGGIFKVRITALRKSLCGTAVLDPLAACSDQITGTPEKPAYTAPDGVPKCPDQPCDGSQGGQADDYLPKGRDRHDQQTDAKGIGTSVVVVSAAPMASMNGDIFSRFGMNVSYAHGSVFL